jgi:hypothetical protein
VVSGAVFAEPLLGQPEQAPDVDKLAGLSPEERKTMAMTAANPKEAMEQVCG